MATFTGTATLTTTNSHAPGPYTENLTIPISFNTNLTQASITSFPTITGPSAGQPPISTPLGNDTYTMSLTPGIPGNGTATYNPTTGQLVLALTLHLHNSVHIFSNGDLDSDIPFTGAQSITTDTCISQDGALRFTGARVNTPMTGGNVTLVGATKIVGGYLNGSDCGLVIQGQLQQISLPAATFNSITFNILTGGDDLRGDSSAVAKVMINGSPQTFTLKAQNESGWNNNTDHIKTFSINGPAQPATAFGPISITLTSHDGAFETNDNWNIQSLNVSVAGPNNASALLRNVSGNPAARLTGSVPTATF